MRAGLGYDNTMQTYWYPWIDRPTTKPDVIACPSSKSGKTAVYVSWNGITYVEFWKVYSGSQMKHTAVRNGFEITIVADDLSHNDHLVVEAVGGVNDGVRSKSVMVGQGC